MMKISHASLATICVLSLGQAHAERLPIDTDATLRLGLNVGYVADAYRTDNAISVLPQGFYDDNRWYIEGSEAGFYPYKDNKHHARIGVTYDGSSFDPDDADTTLQGLDERKESILAHASYMYISPIGGLKAKVATDVLSRHQGTTVTLSHISRFTKDKFTIYPSFGAIWRDKNHTNYYYGVSTQESARTGISAYQADDSVSPFAAVMVNYDLNDKIDLFAHQRIEWLSSTQKDSPLVDGSLDSTTRVGINYKF